ncbi:MAG: hypothetical protein ABW005_03850 [Burkholderiaceae bacterium]
MDSASAASAAADPAYFLHVRTVLSMVVSLAIARVLTGFARIVQHPGRQRTYWVHLVWGVSLLLSLVHFWWWEFALIRLPSWRIEAYVFIIGYAALYYFLCAILFPDDLAEYAGYRDYFYSRRRWFFGLLALSYAMDVGDTWLKGADYLRAQGLEYPLRTAIGIALALAAAIARDARFHAVLVIAYLVYQVSWILRLYEVLK